MHRHGPMRPRVKTALTVTAVSIAIGFGAVQLIPHGRRHENPPTVVEPRWDLPSTRALAVRACFDCHSNQTTWPWYSHVAPASWLVQRHVDDGRTELNFSDWSRTYKETDEAAKTVLSGEMPPRSYTPLHPNALLSAAEQRSLADGLTATLGGTRGEQGRADSDPRRD